MYFSAAVFHRFAAAMSKFKKCVASVDELQRMAEVLRADPTSEQAVAVAADARSHIDATGAALDHFMKRASESDPDKQVCGWERRGSGECVFVPSHRHTEFVGVVSPVCVCLSLC